MIRLGKEPFKYLYQSDMLAHIALFLRIFRDMAKKLLTYYDSRIIFTMTVVVTMVVVKDKYE